MMPDIDDLRAYFVYGAARAAAIAMGSLGLYKGLEMPNHIQDRPPSRRAYMQDELDHLVKRQCAAFQTKI